MSKKKESNVVVCPTCNQTRYTRTGPYPNGKVCCPVCKSTDITSDGVEYIDTEDLNNDNYENNYECNDCSAAWTEYGEVKAKGYKNLCLNGDC